MTAPALTAQRRVASQRPSPTHRSAIAWPFGARGPSLHRETGVRNNEIQKVVVSDFLATAPWTETTAIVPRKSTRTNVGDLKDQPSKDILVFGDGHRLADEEPTGLEDAVPTEPPVLALELAGRGEAGARLPPTDRWPPLRR
jgi:hypothetical protein